MKLDATVMCTMNAHDFRVMEAVEKGMRDHELVPEKLVSSNANLRHGGAHKIISTLLRDKLLSHERTKHGFDGYRLTNAGYDILAMHNLKSRGFIAALGQRIGTGKESDVYLACSPQGEQLVLKFHRLGRTSFRNVRKKRDYFGKASQQAHSWLFLSRLSALKEYAFMKALNDVGYPTPTPVAHNRHIVAMGLVRGVPLYQIFPKQLSAEQAADIYEQALSLASRLAKHGLVHCDLNEFNLMVDLSGIQALATSADDPYVRHSGQSVVTGVTEKELGSLSKPAWEISLEEGDRITEALPEPAQRLENGEPKPVVTLIDFPQMISTQHPNAEELYNRDLACLRRFFELKLFCHIPDDAGLGTDWQSAIAGTTTAASTQERLDRDLRASGFNDKLSAGLELYYFDSGNEVVDMNAFVTHSVPEEDNGDENDVDDDDDNAGESDIHAEVEEDVVEQGKAEEPLDVIGDNNNSNNNEKDDDIDHGIAFNLDDKEVAAEKVVIDVGSVMTRDREKIEREAKERVRRQLEDQKKKARKSGAFRSRNSNKSYIKGKRILRDPF